MHLGQEFLPAGRRLCCICCLTFTVLPAARKCQVEVAGEVPAVTGCWASPASARRGNCWEGPRDPSTSWNPKPGSACKAMPMRHQQILSREKLSLTSHQLSHWQGEGSTDKAGRINNIALWPLHQIPKA